MKTQLKFQVYIDGQAIRKSFSAYSMNAIYHQFNTWMQEKGNCEMVEGDYFGRMAWQTNRGIVEIRDCFNQAKVAQIIKTQRAWVKNKIVIAA